MPRPGLTGELFPDERPAAPGRARPARRPTGPFAEVVLDRPVRQSFTYSVPARCAERVVPGVRVSVPFGRRREVGVAVAVTAESDVDGERLRELLDVLDDEPLVGPDLLELTRWVAGEYACSWGEALHAVLPAALKHARGAARVAMVSPAEGVGAAELAELEEARPKQFRLLRTLLEIGAPVELAEVCRRLQLSTSPASTLARRGWLRIERVPAARGLLDAAPRDGGAARERPERLTVDQERAVRAILAAAEQRRGDAFLLRGVTGSGKTEVYLQVIEAVLAGGRGAIVLVPEIALTPQTVGWFRSRFGRVAVLHSGMSDAERRDMWLAARRGEARVVVGARSALFAPVPDLGVIVVDEEHEPSFKQASTPRYHAREVAVRRARAAGAVCVLGTATPSLESWHRVRTGEYRRLDLPRRVRGGAPPPVSIVDMRQERAEARGPSLFSRELERRLEQALGRGEQAILFLNRRGFTPVLWCSACKQTVRCGQCDQSLTYHHRIHRAVCHSCCEEVRPPRACPICSAPRLVHLGAGSERIEGELAQRFPTARVRRMDSDTMRRRSDYEDTLDDFGRGEIDLLVGTQMIAKGLDFPRVTVVGIVSADVALHLPDFRAAERTFQLVSQVAGRAGRGELPGHIVVQTHAPEHPALRLAAAGDLEGFCQAEDALRAELGYPPHGRLVRVVFEDRDGALAGGAAAACAARLREALGPGPARVLGPAPAPMALVRGRHRHHVLVKVPADEEALLERARELLLEGAGGRPRAAIDVDPVGML